MPTVPDISGPYRLFFYSFDCHEPPHVHVRRERMVCKFWLSSGRIECQSWLFATRTESDSRPSSGARGAYIGGMA